MFRIAVFVLLIFGLMSAASNAQSADDDVPPDFVSDGCSIFPDGNYRECCVAHDKDYFKGGSCKERRESDNRLYRCVKSKKGWRNKILAPIMWVGVRILGASFIPTRHRWGFGKKKEKRKMQVFNKPPDDSAEPDPAMVPTESTTDSESPDTDSHALPESSKAPPKTPVEPAPEPAVDSKPLK